MKIAIDIRELQKDHMTGIGRFLRLFLDNIDKDVAKDIYLLGDNETDTQNYESFFNVIEGNSIFTLWHDQVFIPRVLRDNKIDVFFSPYYKIPFFTKCKRIITVHDLYFLKDCLRTGLSRFKPFNSYIGNALERAEKVITVSEFSKKEILDQFGIKENKIKVVYNGIDKRFRVLEKDKYNILKSKYDINYKYILYVGNLNPGKNVKGLVAAYGMLERRIKEDYKLIIIAKKDRNIAGINKIIKERSLMKNVVYLDFVPDDDLVLFYNFAVVFVFPSFYEGFGFPPLEAMACGAPVISSNATALGEVLGNSALLFNPNDTKEISQKISGVLLDNDLRNLYQKRGLDHVRKYDAKAFSDKLLKEIISI